MNLFKVTIILTLISCLLIPGIMTAQKNNLPPTSNKLKPDHAPTPFTAAEIREGCPRDRTMVFQVEVFGKPMLFRTTRFMSHFDDRTVMEAVTKTADGKKVGKTQIITAQWTDLQHHASFPEKDTKITNVKKTTPAGTFDCFLYTITIKVGVKNVVKQLYFAKKLPGPPIVYTEKTEGKVTYNMVLIKNK